MVVKTALSQAFVCQTTQRNYVKAPTETAESERFTTKSNPTASEIASYRDTALVIYLSEITYFLGLVQ